MVEQCFRELLDGQSFQPLEKVLGVARLRALSDERDECGVERAGASIAQIATEHVKRIWGECVTAGTCRFDPLATHSIVCIVVVG